MEPIYGKNNKEELQAVIQHNKEYADNNNACANECRNRLTYQLTERIYVVCVAAHNIAVLVRIKESDRQALHLVEHCLSHI